MPSKILPENILEGREPSPGIMIRNTHPETTQQAQGEYKIKIEFESSSLRFEDGQSVWRPDALQGKLWVSTPLRFVEV